MSADPSRRQMLQAALAAGGLGMADRNARDSLFRRELLMRVGAAGEAMAARFDFLLDLRRPAA